MEDKVLQCLECGNEFMWSMEEQGIYQARGLSQPKYCPICRGIREAEKKQFGVVGKNPKKDFIQ